MDQDLRRGRGVADGAVKAIAPPPIAGPLSDRRIGAIADELRAVKAEWEKAGCMIAYVGFNLIPLSAIPEIRIADKGLALAPEMTIAPLFEAA